jgi:hypothetical protein
MCLKVDWRAWAGALISIRGCFEKLQGLAASSEFDPYRQKVAEEVLLCGRSSFSTKKYAENTLASNLLTRVLCSKIMSSLSLAR